MIEIRKDGDKTQIEFVLPLAARIILGLTCITAAALMILSYWGII